MLDVIVFLIVLFFLIFASYNDIKTKEVPDYLNYSLVFFGLIFNLILSIDNLTYSYIVNSLFGLFVFWIIASIMYYSGQWGGGDSKLLIGISSVIGLRPTFDFQFMYLFLFSIFLVGAFYGFFWTVVVALKHYKKFKDEYKIKSIEYSNVKRVLLWILFFATVLFLIFLLFNSYVRIFFVVISLLILLTFYLFLFGKSVESSCFVKLYPLSKLTEGDWISEDVYKNGKLVYKKSKTGITYEDIELLHKKNVKSVYVKEGIPFVPSFLIAFIISQLVLFFI